MYVCTYILYTYTGSLTEFLARHHSFVVCWMKEVDHVHAVSKKVLWIIANYVLNTVEKDKNDILTNTVLGECIHTGTISAILA